MPGRRPSEIAFSSFSRVLSVPGPPRLDRRAGPGELGLEVGGRSAQRLGQDGGLGGGVVERCGRRDDGRADAAVGEAREARQVEPTDHAAGREVDRVEMVVRSDHQRRSVLGQVEQVHAGGHLADRQGRDPGGRRVGADGGQVERGQAPVVVAHDELRTCRIDGEGADPGGRDRGDQAPVAQVVGPDLRAGRHVHPLPGAAIGRRRVVTPRLDDGRHHRHAQLAGGADVVLAPGHDAERHGVLGEVRVGPFVDVVREPVPPVLEELRRGPGVVDLVEVHLERFGQAEDPQRQARDDEHDEEPQVEPVEPATALAAQRCAAVRTDRTLAEAIPEPADDAALDEPGGPRPGRHRGGRDRGIGRDRGRSAGRPPGRGVAPTGPPADGRCPRRDPAAPGRRHAGRRPDAGLRRASTRARTELVREALARARPELEGGPREAPACGAPR